MRNKYFYPIFKLKAKSWIRYWLLKKTEFKGKLSDILTGFSFNLQNTLRQKFVKFEIEGNSIQDGEPSPENEVPILSSGDNGSITEKIVNRNFLKVKPGTYQDVRQEITATVNENGTIHVAGATTSNVAYVYMPLDKDLILLPNDYHWSSKNIGTLPSYTTALRVLTTNTATDTNSFANTFLSILKNETDYKNATITNKTTYKYFYIYIAANTTVDFTIDTQIELGSAGSDIVPHEEQTYTIPTQQPMRSIGDVRDVFFKNTVDSPYYDENLTLNGWYERHEITRKILNGTETWAVNGNVFYSFITDKIKTKSTVLSNYFIYTNKDWQNLNNYELTTQANNNAIFIKNNDFTTVADFKTWLSTHNTELIYQLAEPTNLPCTQAQIDILENLPITYNEQTNIYSTDIVVPNLKIQYWESDSNA